MPLLKAVNGVAQTFSPEQELKDRASDFQRILDKQKKKSGTDQQPHTIKRMVAHLYEEVEHPSQTQSQKVLKVSELMSSPVIFLNSQSTVEEARLLMMDHHVRHLPVFNEKGDRLVGMISDRDILSTPPSEPSPPVTGIMTHSVLVTTQDTPLKEVAGVMLKHHISALPVIKNEKPIKWKLVGMITVRDLLRGIWKQAPLDLWA